MTTYPPQEMHNDHWRKRWLFYGEHGTRLHRVSRIDLAEFEKESFAVGTTVCGRTGILSIPGFLPRMFRERCQACAKAVGVSPSGLGNPYNSDEEEKP